MRATTSVGPPAANGTSSRTVLVGNSCACAALANSVSAQTIETIRRIPPSCLSFILGESPAARESASHARRRRAPHAEQNQRKCRPHDSPSAARRAARRSAARCRPGSGAGTRRPGSAPISSTPRVQNMKADDGGEERHERDRRERQHGRLQHVSRSNIPTPSPAASRRRRSAQNMNMKLSGWIAGRQRSDAE